MKSLSLNWQNGSCSFHVRVSCAIATVKLYRGVIDNHILPALGERTLGTIQRADIVQLHYHLHETPAVANRTVDLFAQMFRMAEQWGLVSNVANPCRGVRKYRQHAHERFLTRDEFRRLGNVLTQGDADGSLAKAAVAALRVLILTGCRRNEVLTLRWDDVDFAARELRLRHTKTGPRMVALTSPVESVLNGIARVPGNPWVFVGERPGRRRKTLKSAWKEVKRRAGLHGVRLHDLRHSYASRALALGEGLAMIGKLLNHVELQTTARYSHVMQDAEKDAAARVGDRIGARIGTGWRTERNAETGMDSGNERAQ